MIWSFDKAQHFSRWVHVLVTYAWMSWHFSWKSDESAILLILFVWALLWVLRFPQTVTPWDRAVLGTAFIVRHLMRTVACRRWVMSRGQFSILRDVRSICLIRASIYYKQGTLECASCACLSCKVMEVLVFFRSKFSLYSSWMNWENC